MKIGIATTDYPTMPLTALFDSIARTGFETVQLSLANLSEAGFTPDGCIEIPPSIDYKLIKSSMPENTL
ncbi:hypothetical protein FACS1894184_14390 [Clostridia bacterium]|nr:hypothetical protein FACS1894184_14390 [Clostridia bacterium]